MDSSWYLMPADQSAAERITWKVRDEHLQLSPTQDSTALPLHYFRGNAPPGHRWPVRVLLNKAVSATVTIYTEFVTRRKDAQK